MPKEHNDTAAKSAYCCHQLKKELDRSCDLHDEPYDCPDSVIYYSESSGKYGLLIHDGGSSFLKISFCPFCGTKLTKKNDLSK